MDNSQYIRNTKVAMKIAYRVKTGITAKDTVRLPVSMDMIQGHHSDVQRGRYGTHTLMSEDVQFEMQDGTVIPASAAYYRTGFSKVTSCIVN